MTIYSGFASQIISVTLSNDIYLFALSNNISGSDFKIEINKKGKLTDQICTAEVRKSLWKIVFTLGEYNFPFGKF